MSKPKSEQAVRDVFEKFWIDESHRKVGILAALHRKIFAPFNGTSFLFHIFRGELTASFRHRPVTLLETGFGKGNAPVYIARRFPNVKQVLLDISPAAVRFGRERFAKEGLADRVEFIEASMFDMPLKDSSVDILWNEGVLEHFTEEEQVLAFKEFARVLKPDGKMIIIVPNRRAALYRHGKAVAERRGVWEYGREEPVESWQAMIETVKGLRLEREYSRGFINQFGFLRYYLYGNKVLLHLFLLVFSVIQAVLYPLNFLPGYYLVSIVRKR